MADHSCGSSGDNSGYSTWLCNHGRLFWIRRLDRFGFLFSADTNGIIMCCMLFDDAPKVLVQKIEQVVKLIRSKGVGIYFVTQSYRKTPGAESDSYVRMYWCGSSPRGS